MKNKINTKFLEAQLKLWKEKISKRRKWKQNVEKYKEKREILKNNLKEAINLFKDYDYNKNEQMMELYNLSKDRKIALFDKLASKENIKEFFKPEYFKKEIEKYKETYIYDKLKESYEKNFKKANDNNIENIYKSRKNKGATLIYFWIEYLTDLDKKLKKEDLIKFYDLVLKIFLVPHSINNTRGLHYELCNNNFFIRIREFFEEIQNEKSDKWLKDGALNAKWPYNKSKNNDTFHVFNTNVAKELYGWINLGKKRNDNFIAIYNNKVIDNLKILMKEDKKLDNLDDFYKIYTKYLYEKKPYPENIADDDIEEKLLYADQFFQYIHELEVEQLHKNIIYYGAPGTGKTYTVLENIKMLTNDNQKYYKMIQFHPSYSYEDFIEGIKPSGIDKNGNIKFDLVNGEFKEFCIKANKDKDNNYYFIIDEINRAELSRVFGEILFCLEYRLEDNEKKGLIRTPYANLLDEKIKNAKDEKEKQKLIDKYTVYWDEKEEKSYFGIPDNVYIIGTMNDVDRSIDSFDLALRRRFVWEYMGCDYEVLEEWLNENGIDQDAINEYIEKCKNINSYITDTLNLSKSYEIGHAYFMKIPLEKNSDNITEEQIKFVWKNHLEPLLKEYLRTEYDEKETEKYLNCLKEIFIKNKDCKHDKNS